MYKAKIRNKTFRISEKDGKTLIDDKSFPADVLEYNKDKFHIILDKKSYTAEIISKDKEAQTCIIKVNNSLIEVSVKDRFDDLLQEIGIDESIGKKVNDIKAPMPGMVINVMVENGQSIKKGDAIVVLEAMKMENILKSPADGIVRKIHVTKGDKIEKNQVMVNLA